MSPQISRLVIAFAMPVAVVSSAIIQEETLEWLHQLTPPAADLPEHCVVRDFPADVAELKGLKNQSISTNPAHFQIGDERFVELIDVETVQGIYLASYHEGESGNRIPDFGIIAWAFDAPEHARATHDAFAESYSNESDRVRLWQTDVYMIWLFRDPGISDASFEYFENFIDSKLENQISFDEFPG